MLSGLTQYVPEATLTIYDNLEFLIRLLLSAALGALVGLERSKRRKEAGIRTHCIIACTSALFMIVSKYAFPEAHEPAGGLKQRDHSAKAQNTAQCKLIGAVAQCSIHGVD